MPKGTILLIHGAWHGGWCWDRVKPLLEAQGVPVLAPTLPGLSPQAPRPSRPPGLEDHVNAVMESIRDAEGPVLLVGHSYAGMVITPAADRMRDRIGGLVYVDAAIPSDGQTLASQVPGSTPADVERREAAFRAMAPDGEWLASPRPETLGLTREEDKAWVAPLLRPHPLRTWLEPVSLSDRGTEGIRKTYIVATSPPTASLGYSLHAQAAKSDPEWTYREIAAGHELMIAAPGPTAEYVREAAATMAG